MCDVDIEEDLLCINVGGREFWTYYHTLERLPGTTLSRLAREKHSHETWMESRKCYFFDRSPDAFRSVLEYYRYFFTENFKHDLSCPIMQCTYS